MHFYNKIRLVLLLPALSGMIRLQAQQSGHFYKLNIGYYVYHTSNNAKSADDSFLLNVGQDTISGCPKVSITQDPKTGSILKIDFKTDGSYYIPGYKDKNDSLKKLDSVSYYYYKIISRPNIESANYYISIPFAMLDVGAVTIPFKYRWGKGVSGKDTSDFSTSANVGIYFGYKFGHTKFFENAASTHDRFIWEPSIFLSPIAISETDTAKASASPGSKAVTTNIFGVSGGAAFMFSLKGFTAGFFSGCDFETGNTKGFTRWPWRGRVWVGFGVGIKLSSFGGKNGGSSSSQGGG